MFERFSRQAREAVKSAVEIAGWQGDSKVGPEHLLIAIAQVARSGPAHSVLSEVGATPAALTEVVSSDKTDASLLASLGIDLDEVKRSVDRNFGEGTWARRSIRRGHIPFAPDAKKALELSLRHALALKSKGIDVEHLLLGVLDTGLPVRKALNRFDVEPGQLKSRLLSLMKAAS